MAFAELLAGWEEPEPEVPLDKCDPNCEAGHRSFGPPRVAGDMTGGSNLSPGQASRTDDRAAARYPAHRLTAPRADRRARSYATPRHKPTSRVTPRLSSARPRHLPT